MPAFVNRGHIAVPLKFSAGKSASHGGSGGHFPECLHSAALPVQRHPEYILALGYRKQFFNKYHVIFEAKPSSARLNPGSRIAPQSTPSSSRNMACDPARWQADGIVQPLRIGENVLKTWNMREVRCERDVPQ